MQAQSINTSKLAFSINEFATASSLGRNKIYDAIKSGRLKARKDNGRTIILVSDGLTFLNSLPEMEAE